MEGLKKSDAVGKKKRYEQTLIAKNPQIKTTIDQLNTLYNEQSPYSLNRSYYSEVTRNAETLSLANQYINFMNSYEAGKINDQTLAAFKNRLSGTYQNYNGELDAKVTAQLLALYAEKTPEKFLPANFSQLKEEFLTGQRLQQISTKYLRTQLS